MSADIPLLNTEIASNTPTEYRKWKQFRGNKINEIGKKLLKLEQIYVDSTFEQWETYIREQSVKDTQRSNMIVLASISILHYFQRDLEIIRHFHDKINKLLQSSKPDVCHAAVKVIRWIAEESPEGCQLFNLPINMAIGWLNKKPQNLILNALLIFKKSRHFTEVNLSNRLISNFDQLFKIACGEDLTLRLLVVSVIDHIFRTINIQTKNTLIVNYLHNCQRLIWSNKSTNVHGPLLIMRALFDIYPSLFNEEKGRLITSLLKLSRNSYSPVSIDAFKFFMSMEKKTDAVFSQAVLNDFLDSLVERCTNAKEKKEYFLILEEAISMFEERLNIPTIVELIESILFECTNEEANYAFSALATLLKIYPDTKFDNFIFERDSLCDSGIACLSLMPYVNKDVVQNIIDYVHEGLNINATSTVKVQALKLARIFEEEIFATAEELYDALIVLAKDEDEGVQFEVAKTMVLVENEKSTEWLLKTALFDRFDSVRYEALTLLKPSPTLSTNKLLPLILADPSVEMRRAGIKLISAMIPFNPFGLKTSVLSLIHDLFAAVTSYEDAKQSSDSASLLPLIAQTMGSTIEPLEQSFIIGCTAGIYPDLKPIETEQCVFMSDVKAMQQDPHKACLRDEFAYISSVSCKGRTKSDLFSILNRSFIDKRDGYLLETLAMFPKQITPFLDTVLMVFYRIFTRRKNKDLLEKAANALSIITQGIGNGLNLRLYCPQFIPALTRILTTTNSQSLAISILKLLGTSVDSLEGQVRQKGEAELELSVDVINPSYYSDFTLSRLSRYFDQPNQELFEAVVRIFESAPEDAAKFIEKVIKMFIRTINSSKQKQRTILYSHLEQVTAKCPHETLPFLPDLTDCLFQHVSDPGCMLLCSSLSYTFSSTFIPYSRLLYIAGIGCLVRGENFAETLMFLAFSVCFQNQPITLLLDVIDKFSNQTLHKYAYKIAKNLCFIVQTVDVSLQQARLARVVRTLYNIIPKDETLKTLAFSLAIVCRMSPSILDCFIPQSVDKTRLLEALEGNNYNLRTLDFIDILEMKFEPTYIEIPSEQSPIGYFDNLKVPSELDVQQWLESIYQFVITCSPSEVIRSCASFIERQKSFKISLLPAAFLSCWEVVNPESREHFSEIITKMISQHSRIDQMILNFAEIADRALLPFDVSYIELSRECESKQLALYFLQKEHIRDPTNIQVVELLLTLNNSMGRNTSAQGLLAQTNFQRDKVSSARWNECLCEWQKALDLYDKTPATLSNRIRCHAHLQQWDKIRELEGEFWNMSQSDQELNARHFAWALYQTNDWLKASKFVQFFEQNPSGADLVFLAIFYLRQNKLKEAEQQVQRGLKLIASNRSVFNGGDINKASSNLSNTQLFVEISEAIKMKSSQKFSSDDIWTKRLKGFKRDGDTWIKLIDIRSLIIPPEENFGVYLKMLSVLRNEERWDIIDRFLSKLEGRTLPPDIILASAKTEWARNKHEDAINILYKLRESTMSPEIASKVARTLGRYVSQERGDLHSASDLYAEARELYPNDPRNWIEWAYTNHAISQAEDSDERAIDAVIGFMQAAQLKQTTTIEYLILLFAIFFKIKDSSLISDDLIEDMLNLSPEMIEQVVPQITVQIAHSDHVIRDIVHKILTKYGNEHFQSIMFPLGMYKSCNDPEKESIAGDILNKLQKKHKDEANDSQLFVKGMLDAALTPFERCIMLLDEAAIAKREGDIAKTNRILMSIFNTVLGKKNLSNMEKKFHKLYGQTFSQAFQLFKGNTKEGTTKMWDILRDLYEQLNVKVNKLEIILLPYVNEEIYQKRNFSIVIPGTYSVKHKSPIIERVEPGLQVLKTQQHPRILYLVSDMQQKVKFLLKGAEDLRLDQRIMQFFDLVNSVLHNSQSSGFANNTPSVVRYAIIPLSTSAGLIRWVENADTLHQIICDMRDAQGTSQILEFEVISEQTASQFSYLTYPQRLEMFDEIVKECPADEVRNFLWYRAPNAAAWLETQNNFCTTTAIMSMIGYIIGLGDRHPSNIMIQRDTGRVIHIDFGDTFEKTILRQSYPEMVQFRLTRMIVHALDGGYVEGMFTQICTSTMEVMRSNKSSIVALLEIFIHEPIIDSSNSQSCHQSPTKIIERVASKLKGTDMQQKGFSKLSVSEQVKILIQEATDSTLYLEHYSGWCPYW